jgi:hypothetical protein
MGEQEVISPADFAHFEFAQAEWVKLRQSRNLDQLRDELFDRDQLHNTDLWRYVNDHR